MRRGLIEHVVFGKGDAPDKRINVKELGLFCYLLLLHDQDGFIEISYRKLGRDLQIGTTSVYRILSKLEYAGFIKRKKQPGKTKNTMLIKILKAEKWDKYQGGLPCSASGTPVPPQVQGVPPQVQGVPPQVQGVPPQVQGVPPQVHPTPCDASVNAVSQDRKNLKNIKNIKTIIDSVALLRDNAKKDIITRWQAAAEKWGFSRKLGNAVERKMDRWMKTRKDIQRCLDAFQHLLENEPSRWHTQNKSKFWSLEWLFRVKDSNGEPVDRIAMLLEGELDQATRDEREKEKNDTPNRLRNICPKCHVAPCICDWGNE